MKNMTSKKRIGFVTIGLVALVLGVVAQRGAMDSSGAKQQSNDEIACNTPGCRSIAPEETAECTSPNRQQEINCNTPDCRSVEPHAIAGCGSPDCRQSVNEVAS